MLFTIPQYVFAFYCGYSGQTIFDDYYITLYNLIFTAFPLIVRAVLEQDINYVVKKNAFKSGP
jgi:magnesium-transporting ATPase (P-type)